MTDYCGNIVYKDSSLAFILMPEGRILLDSTMQYEYFIKDHLGNVRSVISQSGEVLEENAYYPFGMQINALSYSNTKPENMYLYNNKELTSDFDLDWYEYGARMYDAQIARFPSLDPKADEFAFVSPYNYAENRPIDGIDLWGLQSAGYLEIQKKIQSGNVKPYKQSTISQGQTNYMRFFNATVSPDMQKEISSNPVYKSVAVGVLATPVVESVIGSAPYVTKNLAKATVINGIVNTTANIIDNTFHDGNHTVESTVIETVENIDIFDGIIPNQMSPLINDFISTTIDVSNKNGIEIAGINKPIKNVMIDGIVNVSNNSPAVKKIIPNSNWSGAIKRTSKVATPALKRIINYEKKNRK